MSGLARTGGLVGAVLLAAALAATPADAQTDAFIELRPDTIQAGRQLEIRAGCGERVEQATVRSRAFPEVTLQPLGRSDVLSGTVTVPGDTSRGNYPVNLRCPNGMVASTDLFVLQMARPTTGPATGGGGTADAEDPPMGPAVVSGVVLLTLALLVRAWRRRAA